MNKILAIAVAALTMVAMPHVGHAQKATSKNNTVSGAAADAAAVGAVFMPGAFAGVPGGAAGGAAAASASANSGWNQPQMIMNSGSAPSTSTFNDCGVAFSGGLWVLTFSYTGESKSCVAQRQAIFAAASLGRPDIAMERMCDDPDFRQANERTNGPQCAASAEARRIADAKRPQPVVVAPAPIQTVAVSRRAEFPRNEAGMVQCLNTYGVAACQ